jgi:hypothetical protein
VLETGQIVVLIVLIDVDTKFIVCLPNEFKYDFALDVAVGKGQLVAHVEKQRTVPIKVLLVPSVTADRLPRCRVAATGSKASTGIASETTR